MALIAGISIARWSRNKAEEYLRLKILRIPDFAEYALIKNNLVHFLTGDKPEFLKGISEALFLLGLAFLGLLLIILYLFFF